MRIYTFLLACLLSISAFSQSNVGYIMDICRFTDLENNPYIESYISIDGGTVRFVPTGKNKYQGTVNVFFTIQRNASADSAYIYADRFNLLSLETADTSATSRLAQPFRMLKRVSLATGKYKIRVEVADANDKNSSPAIFVNELEISPALTDEVSMSEIEYVSATAKATKEDMFTKNGIEILPFVTNGLYVDKEQMSIYAEIYHANKTFTGDYYVRTQIKKDNKLLPGYSKVVKKATSEADIYTETFDIKKLPSGTAYFVEMQLLNDKNQVIKSVAKRFDVVNIKLAQNLALKADNTGIFDKYTDDELKYNIRTLYHTSSGPEIDLSKTLQTRQDRINYLYSYWEKRVQAGMGNSIAILWELHRNKVEYCNQNFKSALRQGWETDRGRVTMRYGKPQNIERYPSESTLLPYEVWRYDRLDAQSNIAFIFYDPDLATNEYALLHSDKYGEPKNPRWRDMLMGNGRTRNQQTIDYDSQPNGGWQDTKLNVND